jgi:hypothetical protein
MEIKAFFGRIALGKKTVHLFGIFVCATVPPKDGRSLGN